MLRSIIIIYFAVLAFSGFTQTGSFMYDGEIRNFLFHLPDNYAANKQYPLVINIHGIGSNANEQMLYSGFNSLSDNHEFIVVYPNGINNAWNIGVSQAYNGGVDDVGFLNALIDTLDDNYNVNTNRIYATGMSMGGFMSYRLACDLNDRIAAIASVTGLMSDSTEIYCQPQRPVPMLHFHGTNDAIVSYYGSSYNLSVDKTINYWQQQNSCSGSVDTTQLPDIVNEGSTVTRIRYNHCTQGSKVILYRINNGGHTWPGGPDVGGLGNTNKDINASEIIWDFFSPYTLQGATGTDLALEHSSSQIYPIPFGNHLLIDTHGLLHEKYKVFDIHGRIVHQGYLYGKVRINTSKWPSGIYFIHIADEVYKVVK